MKKINSKTLKIIPAVSYFWLIWFLSSHEIPIDISSSDKILHTIEYSVMGLFLSYGIINADDFNRTGEIFVFFASLTGAIDEIHQAFVPGRTASFADFAVDILGCAIGLTFFIIFSKFIKNCKSFIHNLYHPENKSII
ncbi:MAG TPA: VanZ family protein [Candidatus Gastranaerophilales bacterium]|nr:VanZ family protein [Candidatus Gastranaerophilales bacterium]